MKVFSFRSPVSAIRSRVLQALVTATVLAGIPVTATAGETPAPTLTISGTIGQCTTAGPSGIPLPNVTVELTGTINATTTTDAGGKYSFTGLTYGGNYTVTPMKARLMPGSHGINVVDIIAGISWHGPPPSECERNTADVNGDGRINTVDLIAMQGFILGFSTGVANVGKYQFTPVSRSYSPLIINESDQNYDTILFGDIAPPHPH
jgi:hypothetical protein